MTAICAFRDFDDMPEPCWITQLDPCRIVELLYLWDRLVQQCPDPAYPIEYLARHTRVSEQRLHEARRIRNFCAHPHAVTHLPAHRLTKALATTRQALRALTR
ncbi:hypothetical protein AB0N14_39525 [Streptomyces sp. NPDC051104]|uniref:hypothetical protein n=1 Tax=Streptomyces sp. NPDC051104 TaxID=3155044 RepID=UPI003413ECDA